MRVVFDTNIFISAFEFGGVLSGVNYFSRSTTIILPYRLNLLFSFRSPEREGVARPAEAQGLLSLLHHTNRRRSCGNVGISRAAGEIPKELWERWEACPWLSTVSTAPPFPQLSPCAAHRSSSCCFFLACSTR
jgi:hypothetical protein